MKLYQTSGQQVYFSQKGNGQFGNVVRTGWVKSKLGEVKKKLITKALNHHYTDKVYKKGNSIFRTLLNGTNEKIC